MIPKPAIRGPARATTTIAVGLRTLAATRSGVQDHRNPCSIRSRDMQAISTTSDRRARSIEIPGRIIGDPLGVHRTIRGDADWQRDHALVQTGLNGPWNLG